MIVSHGKELFQVSCLFANVDKLYAGIILEKLLH
jgi:hypothetical protein